MTRLTTLLSPEIKILESVHNHLFSFCQSVALPTRQG
jgi:hypothetical protein